MEYYVFPQFLQYELTYACNNSCVFCYNPSHKKQPDDAIRFAILDGINEYEIRHVQLTGGEVTLLPNIQAYFERLPNVRWRSFVTNGRIYISGLEGLVDEIYLSLHGDAETHEQLTRAKGSFATIVASIQKYIASGITVHSDTVLTSLNSDKIYTVAEYVASLGMHTLFVNIFQAAGTGSDSASMLTPSIDQIRQAITQMLEAQTNLNIEVKFGTSTPFCLDERLITEGLAFKCGTGDWFASIDPWGELRICNQSSKSYGNVLKEPLHKIWQSKNISEYRNLKWLEDPCSFCPFFKQCLGGCRVDGTNGSYRVDPMIKRFKDKLVSRERLKELYQNHGGTMNVTPYD